MGGIGRQNSVGYFVLCPLGVKHRVPAWGLASSGGYLMSVPSARSVTIGFGVFGGL